MTLLSLETLPTVAGTVLTTSEGCRLPGTLRHGSYLAEPS
jgi:hypothetical protein